MYGDYNGPNKADKGKSGGSCNRTLCQAAPADYYNHGSLSWYCVNCAHDIGQDHVNLRGWMRDWYPKCGHPMFETQEQMDARISEIPCTPEAVANEKQMQEAAEVSRYLSRVAERNEHYAAQKLRNRTSNPPRSKKKMLFRP
jgi:hypothetical protein